MKATISVDHRRAVINKSDSDSTIGVERISENEAALRILSGQFEVECRLNREEISRLIHELKDEIPATPEAMLRGAWGTPIPRSH